MSTREPISSFGCRSPEVGYTNTWTLPRLSSRATKVVPLAVAGAAGGRLRARAHRCANGWALAPRGDPSFDLRNGLDEVHTHQTAQIPKLKQI